VKTISLKKVSAVAVASLGFGLLSVVPAQADELPSSQVTAITAKAVTTSPKVGTSVFLQFGATFAALTAAAGNSADSTQFRASITSFPTGGSVAITSNTAANATPAGTATPVAVTAGTAPTTAATANSNEVTVTLAAEDTTAWSAQTLTYLAGFNFNPTKAGTYEVTVWRDTDDADDIDASEIRQTVSITVADVAGYSAALSTALLAQDLADTDNDATPTATTDAAGALAIRTLGQKAAVIVVQTRDTNNALYLGQTVTATISGSGFVTAGNADANDNGTLTATEIDTGDGAASTTRTASVSASTSGSVAIGVWGDGTAGTGTVTITVTDKVSLATTTLATKTVTWYSGTAATLEVTALQTIATPGVANGCSNATTCTQATLALTPAYVVVAKDSGGRIIPGLTITGTPTDTATIAATTVTASTGGDDKNGRGYYNVSVTGGAAANVGKKSVITFSTTLSDGVTKISATSEASLGGTPATVTMTLDKTTYTPGAPVVITVTAKDSAGNAVGDGTYANLFAGASTLGGAITGSTPAASVEIKGGVKTFTAFAPGTAGTYTVSNKFGTSMPADKQGATISASIVVSDPNAGLLTQIDALNAKIVALNALIAKIMKKLGVK